MSFKTDWEINYYKADYESEEHWELRKAFMEAHKDKFPEQELVCLAQVFTNVEFLGCRYPDKTMIKVAHLSKEVAETFRKSRAGKLKRTFVAASDAASDKAKSKGRISKNIQKTNLINQSSSFDRNIPTLATSFKKASNDDDEEDNKPVKPYTHLVEDSDDDEMLRPSFSMSNTTSIFQNDANKSQQILKRIPDTGFIIYETLGKSDQPQQSVCILQISAAKQGATIKFDMEVSKNVQNSLDCVVRINNIVYASVPMSTCKKETKTQAFNQALDFARKIHYTIKQKQLNQTVSVDINESDQGKKGHAQIPQLGLDNKGFKMMQMLGWEGGALGISGNGIEQPISVEMKIDRSGLGLSSENKLNHEYFNQYLTKYKQDENATYDLVFSKDFSKEERKSLHEISSRLSLKSRSHNAPDGSRILVIYKKLDLTLLANEILNDGLRAQYYELIAPTDPSPIVEKKKIPDRGPIKKHFKQ